MLKKHLSQAIFRVDSNQKATNQQNSSVFVMRTVTTIVRLPSRGQCQGLCKTDSRLGFAPEDLRLDTKLATTVRYGKTTLHSILSPQELSFLLRSASSSLRHELSYQKVICFLILITRRTMQGCQAGVLYGVDIRP